MITKQTNSQQHYIDIIGRVRSMLSLSFSQIKEKYTDYPICLMQYFEKQVHEESIEIRFDEEGFTLTCMFNDKNECALILVFPDDEQFIVDMVNCLKRNYNYDYLKSRFIILCNSFVKVVEPEDLDDCSHLVFYQ